MVKSKEERFKELIQDILNGEYSINVVVDGHFKKIEFYNKEGEWLIQHNEKRGYTYIRWSLIWSIFEKEYNMEYCEIQSFMKDMLLKHLKIKGTTPKRRVTRFSVKLLKHLKIKGTTPQPVSNGTSEELLKHLKIKGTTPDYTIRRN